MLTVGQGGPRAYWILCWDRGRLNPDTSCASEKRPHFALGSGFARTRTHLHHEDCVSALDRTLAAPLAELAAEDVRLALRALGRVAGRVDVEDVLDVIFRDFCIGK